MKMKGILFCCDGYVNFVPDNLPPEDYAGFCGHNMRVYITRDAELSPQATEVLNAIDNITFVNSMYFSYLHLSDWSSAFVEEILTLLDRIEIEDDHTLASQRHAIAEKHGLTVVLGERISGAMN